MSAISGLWSGIAGDFLTVRQAVCFHSDTELEGAHGAMHYRHAPVTAVLSSLYVRRLESNAVCFYPSLVLASRHVGF